MKKYPYSRFTLLLILCLYRDFAWAQSDTAVSRPEIICTHCHPSYISTSTGLNNPTGLIGIGCEHRFNPYFSLEGGIGESTWGLKVNAGIKIYPVPYLKRWALKIGYTYSNGYRNLQRDQYVINGYSTFQKVSVDFKPATNFYLAFHDYYKVGKNIFCYAQFGWSFKIKEAEIVPTSPGIYLNRLSNEYQYPILFRSPRGLVASVGLSYKISNNSYYKRKR